MPEIFDKKLLSQQDFGDVDYSYKYPNGLKFKPKSELHTKLVGMVYDRAVRSNTHVSSRYTSWNKIDQTLTAYIPTTEAEKLIKEKDSRKPVSIVFPYSFAILDTLLTYLYMAFVQDPVFLYQGVSPEDEIGAILLEKVIQQQCQRNKIGLTLHTMFRDSIAYGVGLAAPSWEKEYGTVYKADYKSVYSKLIGKKEKVPTEALTFEGNVLNTIDPYLMLPDPSVPINELQKGEFFGWIERTNYLDLLSKEKNDPTYFNCKYVKHLRNSTGTGIFTNDRSHRNLKFSQSPTDYRDDIRRPVDIIHMYMKIIPRELELGDSEYPEKWVFSIANDLVLIRAQPIGIGHNKFPVVACSPDFDGYSITPISRLETLYGLQGVLDWMLNSHMANVRKTLNDVLVVDPWMINVRDLLDPKEGKLIRLRRPAWGQGVDKAIKQLNIVDVTRQHIGDSSFIVDAMKKVAAADDPMMGSLRMGGPERLTASEASDTRQSAFSRLKRVAKVIGEQAMQDIAYMFAYHTQQLMEEETYIKATGRWIDVLKKQFGQNLNGFKVAPNDLLVDFDISPRDGSIPGSENVNTWFQLFNTIASVPELYQTFDLPRIFMKLANDLGAQNVDSFIKMQPTVASDQQVMEQVQAGNMVPANSIGGIQQ